MSGPGWNNDTSVVYDKRKGRQFGPDTSSSAEKPRKRTSSSRIARVPDMGGVNDDASSIGSFPETWRSVASICSTKSFDDKLSTPANGDNFYKSSLGSKGNSNISSLTINIVENTEIGCTPGESSSSSSGIVATPTDLLDPIGDMLKQKKVEKSPVNTPARSSEWKTKSPDKSPAKSSKDDDLSSETSAPAENAGMSRTRSSLKGGGGLNRTATTNFILIRSNSGGSGGKGSGDSVNCKVLNMREGMRLLKSKDNSASLWAIFHYYARRQNSPEGQNKLRKEIAKSYLYSITAQQQQQAEIADEFAYLDEDSSQMQANAESGGGDDQSVGLSVMTGDSSMFAEESNPAVLLTVDEKKKLKVIVDKILYASMPTSAAPRGSSVMKLPSPIYNNALSDKCNLLSPVMIIQLVRDFGLLTVSNRKVSSSESVSASSVADLARINRIISEIITKGDESVDGGTTASNTAVNAGITSSRSSSSVASGSGNGGTFFSDLSVNSTGSGGGSSQLMSLPVLTTYMNFITFQKILYRIAVELEFCSPKDRGSLGGISSPPASGGIATGMNAMLSPAGSTNSSVMSPLGMGSPDANPNAKPSKSFFPPTSPLARTGTFSMRQSSIGTPNDGAGVVEMQVDAQVAIRGMLRHMNNSKHRLRIGFTSNIKPMFVIPPAK